MPLDSRRTGPLLGALLLIGVALLSVVGCRGLLAPLEDPNAALPQAPMAANTSLVRIATCWEALPLAESLTQAYAADNPRISFDLIPGSSRSARSLMEAGQADLALVAQPIAVKGGASEVPAQTLALDAVVIAVNAANSLEGISREEAAALYGGYRLDWAELGGGTGRPELVSRAPDAVGRSLFEQAVMSGAAVSSAALVMPHDRAVLDRVAEHPAATGHLSRGTLDDRVRDLALDGVRATPDAIRDGRYPLVLALRALVPETAPGETTRFLTYALGSKGQAVAAQRYVPAR